MKTTRFLTATLAAGLLFTACNKEDVVDGGRQKGEVAYATIVLEEGTVPVKSDTRSNPAAGTEEERKITQLELYIFDENGDRDPENGGYANFTGTEATGFSKVVAVTAGEVQVLVAANMNLGNLGTANLDAVKKTITTAANALPGAKPYEVPQAGIPMAGASNGTKVVQDETADTEIKVTISRLYSRINTPTTTQSTVVNIKDGDEIKKLEDLGLDPTITEFVFKGYVVINGLNHSYVLNPVLKDNNTWTLASGMQYHSSDYEADGSIKSVYSGKKGADFFYSDADDDYVYVYENTPQTYTNPGGITVKDSKTLYALLIKGELTDGTETKTRYWRVNLAKEYDYKIFRNGYYNTEIQTIKSVGYGTPEEAEEDDNKEVPEPDETGIVAKITIADWGIFNGVTDL
ncbi:MAG: fimbrial protein [Tannerellaceae bacterium]|nr:fimbrial protein [Tannerellaceae bacterium]